MFKLTRIVLESGESALFLNGEYLLSDDLSGTRFSLQEIFSLMGKLTGVDVEMTSVQEPSSEWCWNDIAEQDIRPQWPLSAMTTTDIAKKLLRCPVNTPCLASLWFEDDFLSLDETLTREEVVRAMDVADERHDANIGLNWDALQVAIEHVKEK